MRYQSFDSMKTKTLIIRIESTNIRSDDASFKYQLLDSRKTKIETCDLHKGSCLVEFIQELQ